MTGQKGRSGRKKLPTCEKKRTRAKVKASESKWRSRAALRVGEGVHMLCGRGTIVALDARARLYRIQCQDCISEKHDEWLCARDLRRRQPKMALKKAKSQGKVSVAVRDKSSGHGSPVLAVPERTRRYRAQKMAERLCALARTGPEQDQVLRDLLRRKSDKRWRIMTQDGVSSKIPFADWPGFDVDVTDVFFDAPRQSTCQSDGSNL
eukprot:scaffold160_cov97-Pinguiococcus_pyrenoidosus.AAC.1